MADGDILFASSFEQSAAADLGGPQFSSTTGGTVAASNSQAKTGNSSLRILGTSAAGFYAFSQQTVNPGNRVNGCLWVRFAAFPASNASGFADFFSLSDNSLNGFVGFTISPTGVLQTFAFDTQVGGGGVFSSPTIATLSLNTWYLLEFQASSITPVTATTMTMAGRVNGGTSQIATAASPNAVGRLFGGVKFGCNSVDTANGMDVYVDDCSVFIDNATTPTWTGDRRVQTLWPDVAQADLDTTWAITGGATTRAGALIESKTSGVAPDATTYIAQTTTSSAQRLPMEDLPSVTTVYGVYVAAWAGSTSTTTANIVATIQNAAGTDHATTFTWNVNVNGFIGSNKCSAWPTSPGGVAWTPTLANGIRMKVTTGTGTQSRRVSSLAMYVVTDPVVAQDTNLPINGTIKGARSLGRSMDPAVYRNKRR